MYLDRFNLKGRVAVVTGGGQGIGLACMEALSEGVPTSISLTAI
jgi:NAD(P)-dependent dehydrogenase (short-subunit alcohol dehydrogenase family)